MISWLLLVLVRGLTTLLPQTGYIHPDEFFQAPEVVAGDLFGYQVLRPWEFNVSSSPIRSVLFPYFSCGVPFYILRMFQNILELKVPAYLLLVIPRLMMFSLSLLVDLCLYKLCRLLRRDPWPCLTVFSSSFVISVFLTRTLTNSTETVLFAGLLLTVVRSLLHNDDNSISWDCLCIGVINTIGICNRPTFVLFALAPCIYWICAKVRQNCISFVFECLSILPVIIALGCSLSFADSLYYGVVKPAQLYELTNLHKWPTPLFDIFNNLTWTPLNFIKYNMDNTNLAIHGVHPKYLHFLVNFPLLYGLVGISCVWITVKYLFELCWKGAPTVALPTASFLKGLLLWSIWVPLLLLSLFSHQEPRFLLPLIVPVVLLTHHFISGPKHSYILRKSWIFWNLLGLLMFGAFHQGAVTKSLLILNSELRSNASMQRANHVIFYHTYMPPSFLLQLDNSTGWLVEPKVHDLAGASATVLKATIERIKNKYTLVKDTKHLKGLRIFVISHPLKIFKNRQPWRTVFPHFSSEYPTDFGKVLSEIFNSWSEVEKSDTAIELIRRPWHKFANGFTAYIYKLHFS